MATLSCVQGLARRQFGVLTVAQLSLRFTVSAVRHFERRGELRRKYRGVYAVTSFPWSPQQDLFAAVAACAEGSAAAGLSAAAHLSLLNAYPPEPEVTAPGASGARGPKGIRLHHATHLPTLIYNGIRTTTPARTLEDIAPRLELPALKAAVRAAETKHRLELSELIPRGKLRQLLKGYVSVHMTESELEALFLELCRDHHIPLPQCQFPVPPYRADFVWHDVGLIVETDGRDPHDGYIAFKDDRVRDRYLKAATGYEVIHFTYEEVVHEAATVAAEVRTWRARRTSAP
jgi:very-short-patch-repair endonuclease